MNSPSTATAAIVAKARSASVLAILERLINRAASAVVGLAMVFFASPREVGLYAGAVVVYSLAQTVGEFALRQTAAPLWRAEGGPELIRRAALVCGGCTAILVAGYAAVMWGSGRASGDEALLLATLAIAGLVGALGLPRLTYAQAIGDWRPLARKQLLASAASVVVGLALVPWSGIGGGIAQTVTVEVLFVALLTRAGTLSPSGVPTSSPTRQLRHMSVSNLFGWLQGQSERVVVGVIGGPVLLGFYAIAFQIARSLSDPAATGLATLLRNRLSEPGADRGEVFRATVRRAAQFGLVLQLCTVCIAVIPLSLLLPESWDRSLVLAALLTAGLPLVIAQWCISTLLVVEDRTRLMFPWQMLGIAVTVGCGVLMATWSLALGVAGLVLRDAVAVGSRAWLARDHLARSTWRAIIVSGIGSAVIGIGTALILR